LVQLVTIGAGLPSQLPQELTNQLFPELGRTSFARLRDDSSSKIWTMNDTERAKYKQLWDEAAKAAGGDATGDAVKECFDSFGLSEDNTHQVWAVSDVNRSGSLSFYEFICAMHLASKSSEGIQLPEVLPDVLAKLFPLHEVWRVSDADFSKYKAFFDLCVKDYRMQVSAQVAKPFLEQARLPKNTLKQIWVLSDINQSGSLSLNQFVCAMHIAMRCCQGYLVPDELPEVLMRGLRQEISPIKQGNSGESLPSSPIKQTPSVSVCSSPMATRELKSDEPYEIGSSLSAIRELKSQEPYENGSTMSASSAFATMSTLSTFSTAASSVAQPASVPSSSSSIAAPSQSEVRPSPSVQPSSAVSPVVVWTVTEDEYSGYLASFDQCEKDTDGRLTGAAAKPFFLQSGLSTETLKKIWSLSDVDQSGTLSLDEFAYAMHLATKCRQGIPLPDVLPEQLRLSVIKLPWKAGSASPVDVWRMYAEDFEQYKAYFDECQKDSCGNVAAVVGKTFLEQSGLSRANLKKIWSLSDVHEMGALSQNQFACAMHLTKRCKEGIPVPDRLPEQLERGLRSEIPPTVSRI